MIYYFTYRHGEFEADVHADSELEAWPRLLEGNVPIKVNWHLLDPGAWDLQDVEEEEHDQ